MRYQQAVANRSDYSRDQSGGQKSEIRGRRESTFPSKLNSAKDLDVYRKGYELSMRVYELSKRFPAEEKYALTGQIRRSSRSVCLNLREAWAKRRYEAHFVSKLTDCDGENSETDSSLDFAKDCGYITADEHAELSGELRQIGRMIGSMLKQPGSFLIEQRQVFEGKKSQA